MNQRKTSKVTNEAKVGILILSTLLIGIGFAWLLGFKNPFSSQDYFYITYNFAGGIDVGSHVRVAGIKVGKVEEVEFFSPNSNTIKTSIKESGSADQDENLYFIPVKLKVSVRKDAWLGIREDSRYYVNLAGLIGERYIEIAPGSGGSPQLKPGATVPGVDPPRIDQLISQSFNLAGKIQELVEKNKGDITKSIEMLAKLSANFNKTLEKLDQSKIVSQDLGILIHNMRLVSEDIQTVTSKARTPEGEKTLKLINELIWRLEPVDQKAIRKFFQDEGIRTKIF